MAFDKNKNQQPKLSQEFLERINFKDLPVDLFNEFSEELAKKVYMDSGEKNKPSQLRRFYDELNAWAERVEQSPDRFKEYLPFIKMLNAKAAYAKGRGTIDDSVVDFIRSSLAKVEDDKTLKNFKTLFESFLGFYRTYKKG